jgi:glycosyltransferase involved in cell wall biosynthesis
MKDDLKLYFWYSERDGNGYMYRAWDYLRDEGRVTEYESRNFWDVKYDAWGYLRDYVTKFRDWEWVVSIPNYDASILPLWVASKLGKQTTFFISTPYWDHDHFEYWDGPDVPAFRRYMWKDYLRSENTTVVTFTDYAADALRDKFDVESRVIPSTAVPDTDVFRPLSSVEEREPPTILFVGRLVPEKGVEYLLEIAENNPELDFWFCGDGPLKEAVQSGAEAHPNIEYKGFVEETDELVEIYNQAAVLAHPVRRKDGWMEFFGAVLVEALACETPVVATDHIGPKDILNSDVGVVVSESKTDEFERELISLANDGDRREEMGKVGRERAVEKYDLKEVAQQWLDAVESAR